ncbi:MAG: hypothetical protein F4139_00750 [Gemmatimonadetes bacterium]|nr:hypothetical protein [Gemmatimonadota bacterium]
MRPRFTTPACLVAVLLALTVLAGCQDAPATLETSAAPETAEADVVWSKAYRQFLADYPGALSFLENTAEATRGVAIASELVRTWTAEHRQGWLRPRRQHGRLDSPLVYPGAREEAKVRAMDGIAAYVASVAEGGEPPPTLLNDLWNLGLQWPWEFPEGHQPE